MKSTNTTQSLPAKQLKLKKECIALLTAPHTGSPSFGPTASCNCTAGC